VTQLLDIFGFLSVLLRGATLVLQSLTIGGVGFLLLIAGDSMARDIKRVVIRAAIALAFVQSAYLFANTAILIETTAMPLGDAIGSGYFLAGTMTVISALAIAALCGFSGRRTTPALIPLSVAIIAASVMTSHAAARVENRGILIALTALHQAATATWIGGLPYLLIGIKKSAGESEAQAISARFSRLALTSVAILFAAGLGMSFIYIDSPEAIYGTAYGVMASSKVILFGMLMVLGALNYTIVKGLRDNPSKLMDRLRSFAAAEIGIGFSVILAAASLTSQPPAADLTYDRLSFAEIKARMTPKPPRLKSPGVDELSTPTLQVMREAAASGSPLPESYVPGQGATHPNSPADIAWSEYNHHWAGLVVLAIGLLSLAARTGYADWARNWPLAFLGLAVFLFLRADPENWPLGPNGFWESFLNSEVLQHRSYVLMIVIFAVFEWRVQTGRIASKSAALVFPLVCAVGGALLLTHSHALGNIKEELLAELSHVPLALLGILAGWARWIEIRLPEKDNSIPSWIWPICFILIGLVLLNYREE
jgi:putative copper resistance protein D